MAVKKEKKRMTSNTPMIWVIDDSPTIREIMQRGLQLAGFQVSTFADGIEVLHWTKNNQIVPALIVVDIMMPYLDGYEVIDHLQKRFRLQGHVPPPFIVISRRHGLVDILKAKLAGASDYVFKPFTPAQIVAVCNRHIRSK